MNFEVLMSCMHQKDMQIIERSNLQNVQTLVVNQCDTSDEQMLISGKHRMLNTNSRGLSVSRNMAINNADADICLIADDDEIFVDDLQKIVLSGYSMFPDADIVIYKLANRYKRLGNKPRRLKKYDLLRVASWQISFKRNSIKAGIAFDPLLGAGTDNGCGEENKFLLDTYKAGMKIYYVPLIIAEGIEDGESTWFFGYDERYFYNHGKTTRYMLGLPVSLFYALYTLIKQYHRYKVSISFLKAAKALFGGIIDNELGKKNRV